MATTPIPPQPEYRKSPECQARLAGEIIRGAAFRTDISEPSLGAEAKIARLRAQIEEMAQWQFRHVGPVFLFSTNFETDYLASMEHLFRQLPFPASQNQMRKIVEEALRVSRFIEIWANEDDASQAEVIDVYRTYSAQLLRECRL